MLPGLPPVEPEVVVGLPPEGFPDAPLLPLEPAGPEADVGLWLGGVGHPSGRGVPLVPGLDDDPPELPPELSAPPDWPPELSVDGAPPPWEPDSPVEPCSAPDGLWLDEPELPLGDDGLCGPEDPPPPPPDEDGEDGEDDGDPPDGDGMPLGIELDVVVLQPTSVTATATASSVEKPGMRCMCKPTACARGRSAARFYLDAPHDLRFTVGAQRVLPAPPVAGPAAGVPVETARSSPARNVRASPAPAQSAARAPLISEL